MCLSTVYTAIKDKKTGKRMVTKGGKLLGYKWGEEYEDMNPSNYEGNH